MKPLALMSLLVLAGACTKSKDDVFKKVRRSIFKIETVSQEPKFLVPWKYQTSKASSGTGFYIGDHRIMTNAHVVANAKFMTVLRDGDSKPVPAFVEYISHASDLAILTVKDKAYFADIEPLLFGEMPKLLTPVSTIGYPQGGEQLSITEGVVSRVGFQTYSHSGVRKHLLVQVDAAINPGNSGGPVMQGSHVAGVAFQGYRHIENTGYIIPPSVVQHFLDDIADKQHDGHPVAGIGTMDGALSNDATAEYYGMKDKRGVIVSFVAHYSPLKDVLKKNDIIISVDGFAVGVDGNIEFQGERVHFKSLVDLKQIGEAIKLTVWRDGQTEKIETKIGPASSTSYQGYWYGKRPRYFVFGGLIFTPLTLSYMRTWGNKWYVDAPFYLRYVYFHYPFHEEFLQNEEFVVLSGRLPHAVNAYLESQQHAIVKNIDGKPILRVEDVAQAIDAATGEFLRIEFFEDVEPIVLPLAAAKAANATINTRYGVSSDRWFKGREVDGAIAIGGNAE